MYVCECQSGLLSKPTETTVSLAPATTLFTKLVRGPPREPGRLATVLAYCLILGFTAEYSKSVRKFTATYVNPIARMIAALKLSAAPPKITCNTNPTRDASVESHSCAQNAQEWGTRRP